MDQRKTPSEELVEPLTHREEAILRLLAESKSYREIAAQEVLALNTVKWYIQQLYTKLGVNNRRQALERSRSLGLISIPGSKSLLEPTSREVHSPQLPTGTVTFLFTDIQGSTPLWEQEPEKMAFALSIHNEILRKGIESNAGVVFKVVGDSFQAVFDMTQQALTAAITVQRCLQAAVWNELGQLQVRMGLHTGEAELDPSGDEYVTSHTKNRVARIMSAAHGGQILLSLETADLVRRTLPEGVMLKDLGEHQLKGLSLPEHLYQVCTKGLPQEFPALETAIIRPNNLPLQMTSFIGREKEITAVKRLLSDHRLVTLTGSGGTGKTRLSVQVASDVLELYSHGAWLVELAPLADPELVPKMVASTLKLPETPGRDIRDSLVDFLRPKRLLLILDNCEHLLQACTNLVNLLLHACPRLTILASSREILGMEGEAPFRVPPMSLPDLQRLPSLENFSQYDAIRLFLERGKLVSPGFIITSNNASTIAVIVNRLDGIPLAIELAAARLHLLSVEQIAVRLNDAFRLLTGGSRTVMPRHQTLRTSIDWSYNLLSDKERILLRRLSTFASSWTLEAAEQVCSDESTNQGEIDSTEILDLLDSLVDKSLVMTVTVEVGEVRFTMLETIRQYAHEVLVNAKEAERAHTQHMRYFYRLTEELSPKIRSREQIEILDCLERDLGNLRLALEWSLQTNVDVELSMAAALKWLWHIRTYWNEGIAWLERGLEAEKTNHGVVPPDPGRIIIRANALSVLGFLLQMLVNFGSGNTLRERTRTCLEESISLYQLSGNENTSGYAWATLFLGIYKDQSLNLMQKALHIFRQISEPHGTAEALMGLALFETDPYHRRRFHQEQLEIDQANGDIEGIASALYYIGTVDYQEAEWMQAIQTFEKSLSYYRLVHNPNMQGTVSVWLAMCSVYHGDMKQADLYLKEALRIYSELGNDVGTYTCWCLRSWLMISEGLFSQANEAIEQAWQLNQKEITLLLAIRARLARLQGETEKAQKIIQEAQKIGKESQFTSTDVFLELGYQSLDSGDLLAAGSSWLEGFQNVYRAQSVFTWANSLDGVALLAARQGKVELAIRLFGTRWCQGFFNTLSPSERAARTAIVSKIQNQLGDERFMQLSQEGLAMTYTQMLETVREFFDKLLSV
jgi:predicted ATPase/class 3 adenylate cyclase